MNKEDLAHASTPRTPKMTKNLTPPNHTDVGGMVAEKRDDDTLEERSRERKNSTNRKASQVLEITRDDDWKEREDKAQFLSILLDSTTILESIPLLSTLKNYMSKRYNINVGDMDSTLRMALCLASGSFDSRNDADTMLKNFSSGITPEMVDQTKQEQQTLSRLLDELSGLASSNLTSAKTKLEKAKTHVKQAQNTVDSINKTAEMVESASNVTEMEGLNVQFNDKMEAIKKLVRLEDLSEKDLSEEDIRLLGEIDVTLAEQAAAKQAARNAEKAAAKEAAAKEAARSAPQDKQAAITHVWARKGANFRARVAAKAAAKQSPARLAQDNNQVDAGIRDLSIGDENAADGPVGSVIEFKADSPLIIDEGNIDKVLLEVFSSKEFLDLFLKASNGENVTGAQYVELLKVQYQGVYDYIHNNQGGMALYVKTIERFIMSQVNGDGSELSNYQKHGSVTKYDYARLREAESSVKDDSTAWTSLDSLDSIPSMNAADIERALQLLQKMKKN